jgi:hypothetical protein
MNKYISGKSAFYLSFLVSASLIGATGCAVTGPELANDPAQQLEDDFGGPGGLLEFFESRSEDEIR